MLLYILELMKKKMSDCEMAARVVYVAGLLTHSSQDHGDTMRLLLGAVTEFSDIGFFSGRTPSDPNSRVGVYRTDPNYNGGFGDSGLGRNLGMAVTN